MKDLLNIIPPHEKTASKNDEDQGDEGDKFTHHTQQTRVLQASDFAALSYESGLGPELANEPTASVHITHNSGPSRSPAETFDTPQAAIFKRPETTPRLKLDTLQGVALTNTDNPRHTQPLHALERAKPTKSLYERLFHKLNEVSQAIIILDEKGRICFSNDSTYVPLGLKKDELLGKRFFADVLERSSLQKTFEAFVRSGRQDIAQIDLDLIQVKNSMGRRLQLTLMPAPEARVYVMLSASMVPVSPSSYG